MMNYTAYLDNEIRNYVQCGLDVLCKNDFSLLKSHINERSVTHKLAEYIQNLFRDWNVDCEYDKIRNNDDDNPKKLDGISQSTSNKTDRVIPDIIIHKRNSDENLLIIEVKTSGDINDDVEKLKMFTKQGKGFEYQLGLSIKFNSTDYSLCWIKNGQKLL